MKRASWWMILIAFGGMLAFAWYVFWPRAALPPNLLGAVPRDAEGVLALYPKRVLASKAWQQLVVDAGGTRGMQRVSERCGFNPAERVDELVAFALPPTAEDPTPFAVIARGQLERAELTDCVRKFTGRSVSSLNLARFSGVPAVCDTKGSPCAAFVGQGGLVFGQREAVASVFSLIAEGGASIEQDADFTLLWSKLSPTAEIRLLHAAPERLLSRLKGQWGLPAELLSALASSVHAAAGLSVSDPFSGTALLEVADAAQARALANRALGLRQRILALPGLSRTPAGAALRKVEVTSQGATVRASGQVDLSTVVLVTRLWPVLRSLLHKLHGNDPPPKAKAPPNAPQAPTAPASPQPSRPP